MGMDDFAPGRKECGQFIVKNISPQKKTISIFNYPINLGCTRDLLEIPGVSEGDIKSALMKGQIRHKFKVGDIELVFSDIDLLQFNDCGIQYLEGYGFTTGVLVGYDQLDGYVQSLLNASGGVGYLWREKIPLIGMRNGINRTFYTPDKFLNGSYLGNSFQITVLHNGGHKYENIDYTIAESGGPGTGYDTINLISFTPNTHSLLFATYAIIA
jgi:hypothetical protein